MVKKKDMVLREDSGVPGQTAALNQAKNLSDARNQAVKATSSNSTLTASTIDLGNANGVADSKSGEGMTIEVPQTATTSQLSSFESMAKNPKFDDTKIKFVKGNGTTTESVAFTKRELKEYFKRF